MTFNRYWLACVGAVLATAASFVMAHGNSVAVIMVTAEVRPSAVFRFEAKTPQLTISAADIAQGYVELPAGAFFNLSAGKFRPLVFLDFSPVAGLVKSVELKSDGSSYRSNLADKLVPGRHVVFSPVSGLVKSVEHKSDGSSYRFNLADKLVPGRHVVPLTLNIEL